MWLIGDFNLEPVDYPRTSIKDPTQQTFPPIGHNSNATDSHTWGNIFASMIEILSPDPTHYSARGMFLNKLDRFFTTIPSHAWLTVQPSIQVLVKPELASSRGLSDHGILKLSVSLHAPPNPETLPIRAEVFNHPAFQEHLHDLYTYLDLDGLPPWERWETHKLFLRGAGNLTRKYILL